MARSFLISQRFKHREALVVSNRHGSAADFFGSPAQEDGEADAEGGILFTIPAVLLAGQMVSLSAWPFVFAGRGVRDEPDL